MKYILNHGQQYIASEAFERLVTRLCVMIVLVTLYGVLAHYGVFNGLVVHTSNLVVGGMPSK